MGLKLIAEGIENANQAALLRQIGVHKLQGYLYSKPLPASDFISFCQANLLRATAVDMKMVAEKLNPMPDLQSGQVAKTDLSVLA